VQRISGFIAAGDGAYWALSDNGFGAKDNSRDYLLRAYKMRPAFEMASGGPGTVALEGFIQLRDSDRKIPFRIVNQDTSERFLTGADFDIESLRRDAAGELWFGDEFGPFLLHTDATGRLLDAPIPLPGVKAPQNPTLDTARGEQPNLPTSRGFEGVAISPTARPCTQCSRAR
jgi:glycerophosphoryl diester phosphodiesterase